MSEPIEFLDLDDLVELAFAPDDIVGHVEIGGAGAAIADVFQRAAGENDGILRHDAYPLAQGLQGLLDRSALARLDGLLLLSTDVWFALLAGWLCWASRSARHSFPSSHAI